VGIDPNSIFNLFNSGSEESTEVSKEVLPADVSDHPLILVGMFTRMVLKGEEISGDIMKFFQTIERPITASEQKHFNKVLIYNRALSYLQQVNLKDPLHVDVLLNKTGDSFLEACTETINFFSEIEEYEKCVFIKIFQDFIKFSQKKLPL
jgi:hypothetical protein